MTAPKELLEFLLDVYQKSELGDAGVPAEPAPLDELDKQLDTLDERMAARTGIKHFLEFGRQYLVENPPVTQIMLAQGFGVQLTNGVEVALVHPLIDDLEGSMGNTPSFHVTKGRSLRNQEGIIPSNSFAVTAAAAPLRSPRT